MKNPCYECEDRAVGCHSQCDRYGDWKAENRAIRAEVKRERRIRSQIIEIHDRAVKRARKGL